MVGGIFFLILVDIARYLHMTMFNVSLMKIRI